MKTIKIQIYKYEELSEESKERAIEDYRSHGIDHFWQEENRESMEEFAKIFPIHVHNWSYGGRGEGVSFGFEEDTIEELNGVRLATYIWNNYKDKIYSKKYYSVRGNFGLTEKKLIHKRVKSRQITNECPNKGKWSNSYHSAITIETYNCPLTGYCMDNELLDEVWKFLAKPDGRTFRDLLEDCFHEWIKACNADIEYQNSDECIAENLEANEYEFTINGKRY